MVNLSNINNRKSGCDPGVSCSPDGSVISKPLVFLGSTVLSFNASLGIGPTQESTLSVELVNDCKVSGANDPNHFPTGEHFYGAAKLGGPVFFDTCDVVCLPSGSSGCFQFGGILTNYTAQQSAAGLTFNAKLVDPRSLLENAILIVDSYLEGPVKDRNYFNVYAYYEYNSLDPNSKTTYPIPTGLTKDPYTTDDVTAEIHGALAFNGLPPFPSGEFDEIDCSVFGTADKNDRGMTGRKVLQALKNMTPLIYSPNYGEPYRPALTGKDIIAAAGKLNHELNVFKLDVSGFPEPPPYYRVSGPSISILQLLNEICELTGREFIVSLDKGDPGDPPIIKIETKKISEDINPEDIQKTILKFNGRSTELSFGEEIRIDKNRTILLGEQEHNLIESSVIQFYFGEDSDGNPIVPVTTNAGCGFEILLEVNELNAILSCPLFDPALHNSAVSLEEKVLKRKVVVSEWDLRSALSSNELWKTRVGAANAPDSEIVTIYPNTDPDTVDFNKVIGYNFNDVITPLVKEIFASFDVSLSATADALERQDGFTSNASKGLVDAAHSANTTYIKTLNTNRKRDLDSVYDFIQNIAKTYYGKQYLVVLPTGVCSLSAGLYDENYFGIGDSSIAQSYSGVYVPPQCSGELTDPEQVQGKIYRDTIYSHVPTNAGGWVEPCVPVLGLFEPELSFFKAEDFRVLPFARFDTKDIKVNYTTGFILDLPDPSQINPTTPISMAHPDEWLGGTTPSTKPDYNTNITVIQGVCGELDISQLSPDDYVLIRGNNEGGICNLPTNSGTVYPSFSGFRVIESVSRTGEVPLSVWLKAEVDEKLYIINQCDASSKCNNVVKAVIKFNDPCFKKPCNTDDLDLTKVFRAYANALGAYKKLAEEEQGVIQVKATGVDTRDTPSKTICGIPIEDGSATSRSSLDLSSLNNKGFCAAADLPTMVCIPLRSNVSAYGPWYSPNFNVSAGGIAFERDNELAPWSYGSKHIMEYIAEGIVKDFQISLSEIETGSITHPGMPELSLGFLDNGPNLTNVNVSFGGGGITTNYVFQTYTPRFGALKNLQNQQLKDSFKNKQRAQKILKDRLIRENKIDRKLVRKSGGKNSNTNTKDPLSSQGTLQRVLMGEIYDFSLIRDHNNPINGAIIGSGQRTVVGTDTLEKSSLEMRFEYEKKAFMSLDGLYSPVSISGDGGLPMFTVQYTGYENAVKSASLSPMPPVIVSSSVLDLKINQSYLNPLTNNFAVDGHHHDGPGAGHTIDIVGRGSGVPGTGMIMNFYGQRDWENRYAEDYRFLGLKGPLVLQAWGYDTQGKPIPNSIDDEEKIRESGSFAVSGLKDQFMQDWLHKPATWPVAPVDLRFDRERGVWVSPPQHKIIVAQATESISPYGSGSGILINAHDGNKYGQPIYDGSGNLVVSDDVVSEANIVIEDRIGSSINNGEKGYAYFDSFSSKYLLLGGGGGSTAIKIGKFMNQWPSLTNVKEPMNAVKNVHLYKAPSQCPSSIGDKYTDDSFCPWILEPIMETTASGTIAPQVVKAVNLFANVPNGEYQSKWCMLVQIDNNYYLLAAEC
jgi:hypothetical protein